MNLLSHTERRVRGLAGLLGVVLATAASNHGVAADREAVSAAKRELTTDRPDATESPFTVEPGHVQVEMDFANITRNRLDGARTTEWEAAPFNLRIGLTPDFEAGIFVVPYRRRSETPRGAPRESTSGFGDAGLRAKLNLFGNDGGGRAFGVIFDLKVPTGARAFTNGKCEGAVTFPVAIDFGQGLSLGAMTSGEAVYTDEDRFRPVWANTITLARDITENFGAFIELTSSTGVGSHVATFNCGVTRALDRNTQLDAGVYLGLTRAAPDATFFAGLSRRF